MTTVDGNIESLSRAILGEAQAEIEGIRDKAREQAEAIRAHSKSAADREKNEILEKARQEARRLKEQVVATAELKARASELQHREEILSAVFGTAASLLGDATKQPEYADVVSRLMREGIDQLRSKSVVIRLDAASRAALQKGALEKIAGDLGLEATFGDPLDGKTGVAVQTPDGRLQFDNTLQSRLERMRAVLRADVYRILVGDLK